MPRSAPLMGLALASLLALSACSSAEEDASAEPAASADAPGSTTEAASADPSDSADATGSTRAAPSPDATGSTSAAPTPDAGAGEYSSKELTSILESVELPSGTTLLVVPTEELNQGMDLAREFLGSVEITPKECDVFISNSLEPPEGAGYAAGTSTSDGDAMQTIVSAASSADTALEDQIEASLDALDTCSAFSVETQGITIDQEVRQLEATTSADRTFGTLATQSSNGVEQETMTVVGVQGDLAVTAVRTTLGPVPEGSQNELQDLVDATLAAAQ